MGISMRALASNRKELRIEDFMGSGKEVNLTYLPSAVNASTEDREIALRKEGRHVGSLVEALSAAIVDWDVTEGDEDNSPIVNISDEGDRRKALESLGSPVLSEFYLAIIGDLSPNRRSGANSAAGSRRKGS